MGDAIDAYDNPGFAPARRSASLDEVGDDRGEDGDSDQERKIRPVPEAVADVARQE